MKCPYCNSSNVVRPRTAYEQGTSNHIGVGVSSRGLGLGVANTKTKEAQRAIELAGKEFNENAGAGETASESLGVTISFVFVAFLYYLAFWVIGYNWSGYGDSFFISIFVLLLYVVIPWVPATFLGIYIINYLNSKGGRWLDVRRNKIEYWMCRSCGKEFTK